MEPLTLKQAAKRYNFSYNYLCSLVRKRKIRFTQYGGQYRVTPQAMQEYLDRKQKQTKSFGELTQQVMELEARIARLEEHGRTET